MRDSNDQQICSEESSKRPVDAELKAVQYTIMDPTGNITALVETHVDIADQPLIAEQIMVRHPEVEQVGFVDFSGSPGLRMAGGEFCGNATISAAALYVINSADDKTNEIKLHLAVSGTGQPVEVLLWRQAEDSFKAGIKMPDSEGIEEREFVFEGRRGRLPLVKMQGISHIIIESDSIFYSLSEARQEAARAVKKWCHDLSAEGMGLMFLNEEIPQQKLQLTPLVYVPASQTVFWENSCASGSSAVGMYLAARRRGTVDISLKEPGGTLRVVSDSSGKDTWLYGRTVLTGRYFGLE